MSSKFDSYQKRRLQSSYISVVVSIALVLFMVGVLGLILLKSTKVANHIKEKVAITLFIKDKVTQKQIKTFREYLLTETFTKKAIYTSKAQAAKKYSKEIGEDFLQFLGENPLKNGVDIYLKADFVTPEKMQELETRLLIFSGFFSLVAMILINSSIRLSIYSKRFNIKTMQMVGATKKFIRKPFIWRSIKLGMIGAVIALIGLAVVIYYLDKYMPSLALLKDYISLVYLAGGVLLSAFIITWLSTFFATQRFLNLKTDELYY
jgi:cell division transport system permease protein